jgi:hypothetical protein
MLCQRFRGRIDSSLGAVDPVVLYSRYRTRQMLARNIDCEVHQRRWLRHCLDTARDTVFGREHGFKRIDDYDAYRRAVPLRDLKGFQPYWSMTLDGRRDVCWPGAPRRILCSGGTTSGAGYLIPVTDEGLGTVRRGGLLAGLCCMADRRSSRLLRGKQVYLGGSWDGDEHPSGARVYKMSGAGPGSAPRIVLDHFAIPSCDVANERDFEKKLDHIAEQALASDVAQIASTPVWLLAFFERIGRAAGLGPDQTLTHVWPSLEAVMYSGASVLPYEHVFTRWLGDEVALWGLYAASEGMISIRDSSARRDMLVLADNGTFFEFVPREEHDAASPTRIPLWEVEEGREYVIALTNPNGLFSYVLGDTVRVTSVRPYRLVVTGRTSFYLNTVGEHVTQEAIEGALVETQRATRSCVREFTVGPGSSRRDISHEWVVEFTAPPRDLGSFTSSLDDAMSRNASDYHWCRAAGTIGVPSISAVPEGTFSRWIERYRNSDPQTKVPKVRNDRDMIDQLLRVAGAR